MYHKTASHPTALHIQGNPLFPERSGSSMKHLLWLQKISPCTVYRSSWRISQLGTALTMSRSEIQMDLNRWREKSPSISYSRNGCCFNPSGFFQNSCKQWLHFLKRFDLNLWPKDLSALWPTQYPTSLARGVLSLEVKRPGHEADYLPPSRTDDKNARAIPLLLHTFSRRGA